MIDGKIMHNAYIQWYTCTYLFMPFAFYIKYIYVWYTYYIYSIKAKVHWQKCTEHTHCMAFEPTPPKFKILLQMSWV